MTLRNARPVRFSPHTLSDTLDSTENKAGGMALLQNLIPDPTTDNVWTCRPAHVQQTSFDSFSNPGAISVCKVVGSLIYGLVATSRTANYDEPFCFNLETGAFITVSGVTSTNVPKTQSYVGDWTPPTMDLCGVNLVVTHPGFDGVNNFIGWFDTTSLTAPVWHAGNITGMITLTSVPSWVAQFNGRAYLGVNPTSGQPSAVFTDPLTLNCTNANQALTFGDNLPLTAAKGLPLSNQLGGVIQSLIVFKGANNMYQIAGDASTGNLSVNSLNVATGTLAPRTIVSSPMGLLFMAPDGLRYIDFDAHVSPPIGVAGEGINLPFIAPINPTRACATCTAEVIRISVYNSHIANTPLQDYWYDLVRGVWSGPHTFPGATLDIWQNNFVVTTPGQGAIYMGAVVPTPTSGVIENGSALSWVWQTGMLPDNGQMAASEITEMQIKTSAVSGTPTILVIAQDGDGNPYASTTYTFSVTTGALFDSAIFDKDVFGGAFSALAPRRIGFSVPVVYNRLAINVTGRSSIGFQIGDMFIRERVLGYMQEIS